MARIGLSGLIGLTVLASVLPLHAAHHGVHAATAQTAQAADPAADAVRDSLGTIVAFATFGLVKPETLDIQVSRDGDHYRIEVPIQMPIQDTDHPTPTVTGTAKPTADGGLDLEALAFPSTATIQGPSVLAKYAIGRQSVTAHVDPSLVHPTSWNAAFEDVALDNASGDTRAKQHFDAYTTGGTLTPDPEGLLNLVANGQARNWRALIDGADGKRLQTAVRDIDVNVSVTGLNQARIESLRAHLHGLTAPAWPDGTGTGGTGTRLAPELVGILDKANGVLKRLDGRETLRDLSFSAEPGVTGTIGELAVALTLGTGDADVDVSMDLSMDRLTLDSVPASMASYLPRNVSIRQVVKGIPADQIMALLKSALANSAVPGALRVRSIDLLKRPNARVGIDPFGFDLGPAHASGSARLMPAANGSVIGRIHIAASGMDDLVNEVTAKPDLRQMAPLLFLAKGMGRVDGRTLVWDIEVSSDLVKVNGIPFGQSGARR